MLSRAGVQSTLLPFFGLLWNHAALAASEGATNRAADLFEQGVRQFSEAQYDSAAKSFLAADELAPNTQALMNGLTAARRAGLHLVVVQAAERALARSDMDPSGTALAREAFAEAARNLTHVEVSCTPSPCTVTLDGAEVAPGTRYILPGTHDFVGSAGDGATVAEHLSMAAGASYRVVLKLVADQARWTERAAPAAIARSDVRAEKPLSPAVFYVGTAATAAFVGLTIWSGVDTLSAKSDATEANWDHVEHLARRTDLFLVGALVLGGATAITGFKFVDWGGDSSAAPVLVPGGAAVIAARRF
jgi:hypothetical protein